MSLLLKQSCSASKKRKRDINLKHTAGIFVAFCLYGVCYRNHDMIQPEKRKDLAKVLVERMSKEVLAKLYILYEHSV